VTRSKREHFVNCYPDVSRNVSPKWRQMATNKTVVVKQQAQTKIIRIYDLVWINDSTVNLSNNKLPCKYQISIHARNIILVNQKVTDVLQSAQQKVLRLVYRDQNACKGIPLYYMQSWPRTQWIIPLPPQIYTLYIIL